VETTRQLHEDRETALLLLGSLVETALNDLDICNPDERELATMLIEVREATEDLLARAGQAG